MPSEFYRAVCVNRIMLYYHLYEKKKCYRFSMDIFASFSALNESGSRELTVAELPIKPVLFHVTNLLWSHIMHAWESESGKKKERARGRDIPVKWYLCQCWLYSPDRVQSPSRRPSIPCAVTGTLLVLTVS